MDSQITLTELWSYSESLESRVNSYWNFFTVLIVAFGGWLLTKDGAFDGYHGIIMISAFSTFALMNLSVIRAATLLLVGISEEIKRRVSTAPFESDEYPLRASSQLLRNRVGFSYVLHLVCWLFMFVRKRYIVLFIKFLCLFVFCSYSKSIHVM